MPVNILDSMKLTNETGWKAEVSFEEGMEKTWKWFYDRRNSPGFERNEFEGNMA